MFLGTISSYSTVLNTPIPFTTKINSNNKLSNTNGVISFVKGGYYTIDCDLTVTGVQNDVTITEYANSTARINSSVTLDATDDVDGISITDAIKVNVTTNDTTAQISFIPDIAGASVSGTLRIAYMQ